MRGVDSRATSAAFVPTVVMGAAGALAILLGLVIMASWIWSRESLLKMEPTLVGATFNSALLFVVAGAALLARVFHAYRFCLGLGVAVTAVGLFTVGEHAFGLTGGIDQWLFDHPIAVESYQPGRMAANAALCFWLSGMAIALIGLRRTFASRKLAIGLLGSLVFLLGTDAAIGYFTGVQMAFRWSTIPMAAVTAWGFVLIGAGILAYVCRHAREEGIFAPRWLSKVVGVVMLSIAFGQWQTLVQREEEHLERITKIQSTHLGRNIEQQMSLVADGLVVAAKHWEKATLKKDAWIAEAKIFAEAHPFVDSVVKLDADYKLQWSYPEKGPQPFAQVPALIPSAPKAIRFMRLNRGEMGQLEFHAVAFRNDKKDAYYVAVVNTRVFLNWVLDNWAMPRYTIDISQGSTKVYHRQGTSSERTKRHEQTAAVSTLGLSWLVRIQPTTTELKAYLTNLPETALFVAVLVALLLTLSIRISEAKYQLSTIVNAFDEAIIGLDLEGRIVTWSSGAARIFGFQAQELVGKPLSVLVPAELAAEANEQFAKVRKGEKLYKFRTQRAKKDGTLINVSISMSPILDPFGQVIGISSIVRDIWDNAQKEAWRKQHWNQTEAVAKPTDDKPKIAA